MENMDKEYNDFKKEYQIRLNSQQERAVETIDGKTLLLAVPGSGKTTVLVDKLGYMIHQKGIKPESVLAVTFNRLAASEIEKRYTDKFGRSNGLSIQTINSLSLKIYSRFCRVTNHPFRETIDREKKTLILNVYRRFSDNKFPGESDLSEVENAFTYIKNMCIEPEDAEELFEIENLKEMYQAYEKILKSSGKMDFDDQMVFAKWILEHRPGEKRYWSERYRYICVDEAQDTSKIQHQIIRNIADGNSLFMVGDEDQSIYGFRAAYPEALLNFRKNYGDGRILKMETNYRSTKQIVDAASDFISRNRGRYRKNMTSARGEGAPVTYIEADSRGEQFTILQKAAEQAEHETAFLYRDNESAVVLADLLLRKNIPFSYHGAKNNFFSNKTVTDYIAYLRLITDNNDLEAFSQIGNKSSLRMNRDEVNALVSGCRRTGQNLFDILKESGNKSTENINTFITLIQNLKEERPAIALRKIRAVVYSSYLEKFHIDDMPFETLVILADQEKTISGYLLRLKFLKEFCSYPHGDRDENRIILSTMHSIKGREFDTVYLFDVYDEKFSYGGRNLKGKEKLAQEVRRIFYVAMTRAERKLNIVGIRNRKSGYLDEIFGKNRGEKRAGEKNIRKIQKKTEGYCNNSTPIRMKREGAGIVPSQSVIRAFAEETAGPVTDEEGFRWLKCQTCGRIKREDKFSVKDTDYGINYGICQKCSGKKK